MGRTCILREIFINDDIEEFSRNQITKKLYAMWKNSTFTLKIRGYKDLSIEYAFCFYKGYVNSSMENKL